jgi:hypothetical protein
MPSLPLAYTVVATLPDERTLAEYTAWLLAGHIQAVLRGGATSAEVIGPDPAALAEGGAPIRVESRYIFPTRAAFEAYEAVHAPALRADGAARFGGRPGVSFSRAVGLVLGREEVTRNPRA